MAFDSAMATKQCNCTAAAGSASVLLKVLPLSALPAALSAAVVAALLVVPALSGTSSNALPAVKGPGCFPGTLTLLVLTIEGDTTPLLPPLVALSNLAIS